MTPPRCSWLVALAAATALAAQQAPPAFVECDLPADAYVGQVLDVVVRIGSDEAFFRDAAVPLFQQRLDRLFQLSVPWLQSRSDRAVELRDGPADGPRFAVGDRVLRGAVAGRRTLNGRSYELLELRARWTVLAAGDHTVEPLQLRYAFATAFEDHFLRGRQPLDRQDASVQSPPAVLRGRELPTAGRPATFHGAVGDFTLAAAVVAGAVPVGGTFRLVVTLAGDGNLDRIPPLPWPTLPGFLVQGLVERRTPGARVFEFDVLALRAGLQHVPPVEVAAFVPRDGTYRTLRTAPVPLQVVAASGVLPGRIQELVDADARAAAAAAARPAWHWAILGAGLLALLAAASRWRARRRRRAARAAALLDLAAALTRGPAEAMAALASFCAVCGMSDALADGSSAVVLPAPLARLRELHRALDAARYGGVPPSAADVVAAAREWLRALG